MFPWAGDRIFFPAKMMHKGKGQKICRMKNGYASVWGKPLAGKEDSGKNNRPVSKIISL